MPIYVYKCSKCGEEIEMLVKSISNAASEIVCDCGGTLERVPSGAGFKINGYSYSNGYDKTESINYDGSDRSW